MNRVYVKDLECFKKAREKPKWISPEACFDLDLLPTDGLKGEWREYLLERGRQLSAGSIRAELWPYHVLCRFLKDRYPALQSFREADSSEMFRELKKWMMKNGYCLTANRYRREFGRTVVGQSPVYLALKRFCEYFLPEEEGSESEKDRWDLSLLGFAVRNNPVHPIKSFNFTGIHQTGIREEVKKACYVTLRYLAVATVHQQLRAVKRLSDFLQETHPDVRSLLHLEREQLEEYLIRINTEDLGKKSFRSELSSLKSLLEMVGRIYEKDTLVHLFLPDDLPPHERPAFPAVYSDGELLRLNGEIRKMQEQIVRVIMLQQILANRISETLTLKQDCLVRRSGHWMVRIFEIKTQRTCYKPANPDVIKLIRAAAEYTRNRYGMTEYLFVNDRNPSEPMKYDYLQYHLMAMIRESDLCDDEGNPFGVWTHRFRHSFARRTTEMHVDDITIARLLGQRGSGAVRYYRTFGSQAMAEETREIRRSMDDILFAVSKEWGTDEKV